MGSMRELQGHRITRANLDPVCGVEVATILQPFVFEPKSLLASFLGASIRVVTIAASNGSSTFRVVHKLAQSLFTTNRAITSLISLNNSTKRVITAISGYNASSYRVVVTLSEFAGSTKRTITTIANYAASTSRIVLAGIILYFKGLAIKDIYSGAKHIKKAYRGATKLFDKTI